jgi:hypothetical protein
MESTMDGAAAEMPRYQSHKKVWALKIKSISEARSADGAAMIEPEDHGYASFWVTGEYMRKHSPKVGGYYVVYDDGYKSWSPAQAFEEGYTRL